jgi:hypothetical protein
MYCGQPADTLDHVPPVSRISDYEALRLDRERYFLVRSCADCNVVLGNSLQETILQRAEYLKDRLEQKHRNKLKAQEWDEEELQELGPRLRSSVRAQIRTATRIRARIDYYAGIDAVLTIV